MVGHEGNITSLCQWVCLSAMVWALDMRVFVS